MKKKLIIFSAALVLSVGACIASCAYTTSCGSQFMGPSASYFDSQHEWSGWVQEMNDVLCGEQGGVAYTCDSEVTFN